MLASVVASLWIPATVLIAAFIGAGLAFAAVTDTCAMGMLLARLPYNRTDGADVEAAQAAGAVPLLVPTPVTRAEEVERAPRTAPDLLGVIEMIR